MANPAPRKPTTSVALEDEPVAPPHDDRVSLGLLSLVAGGVGLLLASVPALRVLTVPFCLIGLVMGVLEFFYHDQADRHLGRASTGAGISLLVLLIAGIRYLVADDNPPAPIAPQTQAADSGQEKAESPGAIQSGIARVELPQIVPFPCGKHLQLVPVKADKPDEPTEWVDATSAAALQGEVAVCVASAAVQPLEFARDDETETSPDDYLVIRLQVLLIGTTGKVDFESWGNINLGDAKHKPSLTDSLGNTYEAPVLEDAGQLVEYERDPNLYPKLYADDLVIFDVPLDEAELLRLELPASAFGGEGTLRFQIPKSMIEMQVAAADSDEAHDDSR